jgi:hypothetical protein
VDIILSIPKKRVGLKKQLDSFVLYVECDKIIKNVEENVLVSDIILPNHPDLVYQSLLREILEKGVRKTDRTGTGTISRFGMQRRYDLTQGFPLLTTKRIPFRLIASV